MKLLIISNNYPPFKIGGYELLCKEVVDALNQRGHSVKILTSTYGVEKPVTEGDIYRLLKLESDLHYYSPREFWMYPQQRSRNDKIFREIVHEYRPDVVFFWGMWALSKNIAKSAEAIMGGRIVYYLANPWPIQPSLHQNYWDQPANTSFRTAAKRILRALVRLYIKSEWEQENLDYLYTPVCSEATKNQLVQAGVPLKNAPVLYEGINLPPHLKQAERRPYDFPQGQIELLYVGILAPHKGVHTAIDAIAQLNEFQRGKVHLTILGTGQPDYAKNLRILTAKHNLNHHVTFHEPIPRNDLPEFLGKYDVLLLPSIWEEPLALIMQEGLASGMVVIGSSTGGTKEIVIDNKNGYLFKPEDHIELAGKISNLIANPAIIKDLARQGVQTAKTKFNLTRMIDDIETFLKNVTVNENAPHFRN